MAFNKGAVRGLKQTRAAFRRVHPVMQRHLNGATRLTAIRVLQAAQRRVQIRYGFLNEALGTSFSKKTGVAKVGIDRKAEFVTPAGKKAKPSKYGHLVEFGTTHSRAFPFMLISAEEQREPYLQRSRAAGKSAEAEMAALAVMV